MVETTLSNSSFLPTESPQLHETRFGNSQDLNLNPIQSENGFALFQSVRANKQDQRNFENTTISDTLTAPSLLNAKEVPEQKKGVIFIEGNNVTGHLPEIKIGKMATLVGLRKAFTQQKSRSNENGNQSILSERERITALRSLVVKLQGFQGAAELYARNRVKNKKTDTVLISPLEEEFDTDDRIEWEKSQTMIALLQLDQIDSFPLDKKAKSLELFKRSWGEASEDYLSIFRNYQQIGKDTSNDLIDNSTTRKEATNILADFNIPVEKKIELFMKAGFTQKDAIKAVLFTGGALLATSAISSIAESGAALSAVATTKPFVSGLEFSTNFQALTNDAKALGIDTAAFAGFYATTALYAKLHASMTEISGVGMNVWATGMHYIDKALGVSKEEIRKDMMKTIFIVNLMLDLPYLSTALIPQIGPSMMANAYKFGIEITATQAAVCTAVIGGAKAAETIKRYSRPGYLDGGMSEYERIEHPLKKINTSLSQY